MNGSLFRCVSNSHSALFQDAINLILFNLIHDFRIFSDETKSGSIHDSKEASGSKPENSRTQLGPINDVLQLRGRTKSGPINDVTSLSHSRAEELRGRTKSSPSHDDGYLPVIDRLWKKIQDQNPKVYTMGIWIRDIQIVETFQLGTFTKHNLNSCPSSLHWSFWNIIWFFSAHWSTVGIWIANIWIA